MGGPWLRISPFGFPGRATTVRIIAPLPRRRTLWLPSLSLAEDGETPRRNAAGGPSDGAWNLKKGFNALEAVKTASNVTAGNLTTLTTDQRSLQDLLDAQRQDGVPSQDQSPLSAPPRGWNQAMPGRGGMGGFAGGVGMGGIAMTGPRGGGFGSQTAPIGLQQAPAFSLQQQPRANLAVDEEATPAVAQPRRRTSPHDADLRLPDRRRRHGEPEGHDAIQRRGGRRTLGPPRLRRDCKRDDIPRRRRRLQMGPPSSVGGRQSTASSGAM